MTNSKPATGTGDYSTQQYSVWQQGATAAREGKPATDNPHKPHDYRWVTWNNGWSFTRHNMAKADWEL